MNNENRLCSDWDYLVGGRYGGTRKSEWYCGIHGVSVYGMGVLGQN